MTTDVAMFGIFRSGTNYLRTTMEWNYDCRLINDAYGWKHGFFPSTSSRSGIKYRDMPVVVVVRNPFMALYSLQRYHAGKGKAHIDASEGMKSFLRNKLVIRDSTNPYAPEFRFANAVDFWNNMNWHYHSIKPRDAPHVIVKYEDALSSPLETASGLAETLNLKRKSAEFEVPEQRTKNMHDGPRSTHAHYIRPEKFDEASFFLERGYLDAFDRDDLSYVREVLDKELVERLGYDRLVCGERRKYNGWKTPSGKWLLWKFGNRNT